MQMPPSDATTMRPTVLSSLTLAWTAQVSQMKATFNQICSQIATCANVCHWLCHRNRHSSCLRPVVKWNISAILTMLICLIERTHEQLQSIQMVGTLHPPLHPLDIGSTRRSLRHPVIIELYSPTLNSQPNSNEFNWRERRTFQSLPELRGKAWSTKGQQSSTLPQWTDDGEQYRSINALFSNPPKSPLSPQAFFAPSAPRRQLPPPLSTVEPTSMFVAAFDGTEEATTTAADVDGGGAVRRNTGKECVTVDRMPAARQIDRMSQQLRPTLQLVASKNIDNVETIGDEQRGALSSLKQQSDGEEEETGGSPDAVSRRARRISRRKLEHYDNSEAHIAPPSPIKGAKKKSSSAVVAAAPPTISTHQKDKQANDADSESNGISDRKQTLDAALDYSPTRNATETKYANERAPEDNRPDNNMDSDGKDNPDKGDPLGEGSTAEQERAANSNLPSTVGGALKADAKSEVESKYIAEEKGTVAATTATVTPSVQQPQSANRQNTVLTVKGEGEGALDDNANLSGNDGADSPDSNHNEPSEEESSEEENLSRINHYSSSSFPLQINAEGERNQNVSSLVSKDYSNRDRGFGFIKAWAWDREENYSTKEKREGAQNKKLKLKQSSHFN